jgi:NosR/NirI family nitrite reductase transcriptional regulator
MKRSAIPLVILSCLVLAAWPVRPHAEEGSAPPDLQGFAAQALGAEAAKITVEDSDGMARPVLVDGSIAAYIGSTWAIAKSAGYSGRPIDVLVLVDRKAVVRGALLVQQQEPVLTLGITPEQIASFVNGFAGYDLNEPLAPAEHRAGVPDVIAGATISSGVIRSGVIRTARTIAQHYDLIPVAAGRRIDMMARAGASWPELVAAGAVKLLHVTAGEADTAIGIAGSTAPDKTFIDLYTAVIDPPAIGASLLGEGGYSALTGTMGASDHAIFIAASGLYSFKGTAWRKSGKFERIEIAQGSRTIAVTRGQQRPIEGVAAADAPDLRETGLFVLPQASGFDPTQPFRLSLIASRDDDAGIAHSARFTLDYALPERYLLPAAGSTAADVPLWQQNWQERAVSVAIVAAMLLALYLILIFQNQIAARPRLYQVIRNGYLLATLVVLGLLIGAQLSVVHVLTFIQALRGQFSWETFLLDPVIFIIWGWVAVALLFWGRVYCGWLCPFGALQELINKLAQRLGVRQISVPFLLHERLWPIKYILFLGLFAASLSSMTLAFRGAEVEPFKTVVTLRFMREWPFVLYAVGLLGTGLFVERFFCRYLCPLGAALAIPARLRMFEWLKRRPQCGRECRICATKCPVQAIHPEGHINPNECIYCLNCQTLYHDEHICPPLKTRAARRVAFNTLPTGQPEAP